MQMDQTYLSQVNTVEIVLKIVERCNLNCSYCYYFNGGNNDFEKMPAVMTPKTASDIGAFLAEGAKRIGINQVNLDFHGGEPLFLKKERFIEIVEALIDALDPDVKLRFAIQTNAALIDDEWIDILSKYNFLVGVSLDGPKSYNDKFRIDHKGRSSYDDTVNGIRLLREAYESGRIKSYGGLAVINHDRHFVDDLKFPGLDFLLPDYTHDNFDSSTAAAYGDYLINLFELWKEDFEDIEVRRINNLIAAFSGDETNRFVGFSKQAAKAIAFTIHSDGTCAPDDILRITPVWDEFIKPNVTETTLEQFLLQPLLIQMEKESRAVPPACEVCCWANICGGGGVQTHQYDSKNHSFHNPSVFCESLQQFYAHVAQFLLDNGMPQHRLLEILGIQDEEKVA